MLVHTWPRRLPPPGGPEDWGAFASLQEETRPEEAAKTPIRTVLSPLGARRVRDRADRPGAARGPVDLDRGRRAGGEGIAWLLRGLLGVAAYAFPTIGVWWGYVLLRDTAREDRVRMFIGFVVLALGVLGLISLFVGNPAPADGWSRATVPAAPEAPSGPSPPWPLSQVLSPIGAAVVCAGLASLGLLIFTGTSFASLKERLATFREERDERDPVEAKAREAEQPSRGAVLRRRPRCLRPGHRRARRRPRVGDDDRAPLDP